MDKEKKQIGNIIAELRKERGWTQNELAEKLNVSDKAISKWESNKGTPSIDFFPDLAKLFKVSIDYLFACEKNVENFYESNESIYEGVKMEKYKKRTEFFNNLKEHFETTPYNGKHYTLYLPYDKRSSCYTAHAWFENKIKSARISVRINNEVLDDINIYIDGDSEKFKFNKLLTFKNYIEDKLGYKLVWDKNMGSTASRIGRFGKYSRKENKYQDNAETYIFDLDVEKVANELVKFYKVFAPIIEYNL